MVEPVILLSQLLHNSCVYLSPFLASLSPDCEKTHYSRSREGQWKWDLFQEHFSVRLSSLFLCYMLSPSPSHEKGRIGEAGTMGL